jgi:putative ABC transport system permease protein
MTKLYWLFNMAWRDSRKNRPRLLLFISSIVFGIAALVAIYAFGYDLRRSIDEQAASLIGADLSISTNKPVDKKTLPFIDSISPIRSEEHSFVSMVLFPKTKGTRLVQVRALQGDFPYYGEIETTPATAGRSFRNEGKALVDKTLMLQYSAEIGDSVKVGEVTFMIAGILNKAPGQTGASSSVAPIVYIPLQYMDKTGLAKTGSRIEYTFYYKLANTVNVTKLVDKLKPRLDKEDFNYETVETRKENTGRFFGDLTRFLSLVGFIALLLGCVGVASAINVYVREKISSIAIMRCLGATAFDAFMIYLIQIVGIGLVGSVMGAALGSFIQNVLPLVLKDFLPLTITTVISWAAIGQGIVLGVVISFLFALLPLISIRTISPLFTFRLSFEQVNFARDPLCWLVYGLIVCFIIAFAYLQLDSLTGSIFFTIGIFAAFLILTLTAKLLMYMVRLVVRSTWGFLVRQGFANLHRPNNQTIILIVAIGLSTTFIGTLFLVKDILTKQLVVSGSTNQSNMILFDIQTKQEKAVADLTARQGLPVMQQVPIITARIEEINGKNIADIKKDTTQPQKGRRGFGGELRLTYRDSLTATEKIVGGKWVGVADSTSAEPVPISMEDRYANNLGVKVGDHITFNVQGTNIATVVASLRSVEWNRVQTNFRVIFPKGVLEQAPQFHVLLTRVSNAAASVKYQQAVVQQFPNISIIDLGLVLSVLDELLSKIGYVINFMAAFSIVTGIIVLIASVRISKYQRIQESVLLRTLGATTRQILTINLMEYFFLGLLSALTGLVIAIGGTWLLAKYSFHLPFVVSFWPVALMFLAVTTLTIVTGLLNSRGILNRPPLEVLRKDV